MKQLVSLVLTLALLSVGAIVVVANGVNANKDTVTHTENAVYGDRAVADGITVRSQSHYDNHLVWDSIYTVGGETETKFDFHYGRYYVSGKPKLSGFIMNNSIHYGFNTTVPASEQHGISKVYKQLYDTLDYDEEGSATVKLADHYDYYPLDIHVNLPILYWNADSNSVDSGSYGFSSSSVGNSRETYDKICEFFKIPVLEEEYVDINVKKHRNGMGFGHSFSDKSADYYSMSSCSTYTDKVCFIYISNRTENGNVMDFSNIPGGYGIYAIPYNGETLNADGLSMVYALDEKTVVQYMMLSNDESKLLMMVYEKDGTYLEVVDTQTMTQLQKLKIYGEFYHTVFPKDGFIAIEFQSKIAVIEEFTDGRYELKFVADKFDPAHTDREYFHLKTGAAMDFDGERLVIVDNISSDGSGWYDKCGFFIAIYAKDGLNYYGEYESSLDANRSSSNHYGFNCQSLTGFEVKWGK